MPVQVVSDHLLVFWVQRHVGSGEELIVQLVGIEDLGEREAGGLTLFIWMLRRGAWLLAADLVPIAFRLQIDHLPLGEEGGARLDVRRFVSKDAQIELESRFIAKVVNQRRPDSLLGHVSQLRDHDLLLLVLLDHPL